MNTPVDLTGASHEEGAQVLRKLKWRPLALIRDPSGGLFIHHEVNAASGGHVEHEDLAAFLSRGDGPEQQELLRLIGTLVEEHPAHA
ncbi:hypothetical protein ACETIH_25005 [Microvirga arabica]|uniref:Uncharacterized protein n=1 Tax=Microvirga arabica TaxID=1128671 RepID=A0ABV6YF34_9HYPH